MQFDGTQKLIGTGAQAEVFLYEGYAYKVYKPTYPAEWIAFEKSQQKAVNDAGLCSVRYYDTDDEHIIKMNFVDGEMLEKRALTGDITCFNTLADAFRFVHSTDATGINMPFLKDTAGMGLSDADRDEVLEIITRLSTKEKSCVCHLDMHFLNIMLPRDKADYVIIDWMNARLAPAVFDYARTYVIFDEFSKEGLEAYKAIVLPDLWATGIKESDFMDAVRACTIIRKREKNETR